MRTMSHKTKGLLEVEPVLAYIDSVFFYALQRLGTSGLNLKEGQLGFNGAIGEKKAQDPLFAR